MAGYTHAIRSPKPLVVVAAAAFEASTTISTWRLVSLKLMSRAISLKLPYTVLIYLHRSLVNQHSVQLDQSIVGGAGFAENDSCNSPADAIGAVRKHGLLDWPNRFGKVFLYRRNGSLSQSTGMPPKSSLMRINR